MEQLLFFAFFLPVIAVVTAVPMYIAFRLEQVRKGQFHRSLAKPGHFTFRSDFGFVDIDTQARTVQVGLGVAPLPFAAISRVDLQVTEEKAPLAEEFFLGLDLLDLTGRYRDRVRWHTVVLRLHDGRVVPVFVAGQLHRREFLATWMHELQRGWMQRRGWLRNARAEALRVAQWVTQQIRPGVEREGPAEEAGAS